MDNTATQIVTKLGTARRVPASRIWIEGARLTAHGFTPGQYFAATFAPGPRPRLTLELLTPDAIIADAPRKVSGKGAKPIIDITGQEVRDLFPDCSHVLARFAPGLIVISPAA